MFVPRVRTPLALLLSATVLALGSVPPGIRHTHAGGDDVAHRHASSGADEATCPRHHHPHADHRHAEDQVAPSIHVLAEQSEHLHFMWWGLVMVLPAPACSDGPSRTCGAAWEAVVLATAEAIPAPPKAPMPVALPLAAEPPVAAGPVCRPAPFVSLPMAVLLCDRARHQRSGVLLA